MGIVIKGAVYIPNNKNNKCRKNTPTTQKINFFKIGLLSFFKISRIEFEDRGILQIFEVFIKPK